MGQAWEAFKEQNAPREAEVTNYMKYRGKCKEMSEALVAEDPSLRLAKGFYYAAGWGPQGHWWCVKPDGTIVDPTKLQFPCEGRGHYEEIDENTVTQCAACDNAVTEKTAHYAHANELYCSYECCMNTFL